MALFASCRMRTFARLISDELGVRVVLKGKSILARDGRPPVIELPAMEYASEEVVQAVRGFALHEAGHIKWSDFKVCREMTSYAEKEMHNAIEDEWVEHRLERKFPGAREMLAAAHREGLEIVHGRPESLPEKSWLEPGSKAEMIEKFKAEAKAEYLRRNPGAPELDAENAADQAAKALTEEQLDQTATRLELRRAALCWLYRKRGYDKWIDLHDWDSHPWKPVFDEETAVRAKNSWEALDQARRILARLGVQDALPGDRRPADELKELAEKAKATKQAARTARRKLREARGQVARQVRSEMAGSPESAAQDEARKAHGVAQREVSRRTERNQRAMNRTKTARERWEKAKEALEGLRKRLESCTDPIQKAKLEAKLETNRARVDRLQRRLAERNGQEVLALRELERAQGALAETAERLKDAEAAYEKRRKAAFEEARGQRAEELERLEADRRDTKASAVAAKAEHEKLDAEVRERDTKIEAPIQPGVREEVVKRAWERHRNRPVEEDLASLSPDDVREELAGSPPPPDFSGPARTYVVADRSLDRVEKVHVTPQAKADHQTALREQADLIRQLVESLRRLHAPVQSRIKVNVERGRLDPKRLYRVGMALRGVPVDARRVWKTVVTRPDPKVAVSLLLDCSGSMTQVGPGGRSRIQVAVRAAAAMSAALTELSIPHEVLGHTTVMRERKPGEPRPDLANFSRFAPFRGYVFKGFQENADAAPLFAPFEMAENLDGEAVLWAAKRLEARTVGTKVLLVISDGLPAAADSNIGELERHLLGVCRALEARESEGVHLCGIGIGEERVNAFYRNCEVIREVEDLPGALVGVVEGVLVGVGSSAQGKSSSTIRCSCLKS